MRTAIYVRVSTNGQSTDSQKNELLEYCQRRGWQNPEIYEDTICGASTSRPALDRLLLDIRTGKIERLLCHKLDRLGRSLAHLVLVIEELTQAAVPLICVTQGIDTSNDSPAGRLQLNVLMAVAEFERGIIKERVNAGLKAARARGVQLGRRPTLVKHASAVQELRTKGLGIRAIARELELAPSSVCSILKG